MEEMNELLYRYKMKNSFFPRLMVTKKMHTRLLFYFCLMGVVLSNKVIITGEVAMNALGARFWVVYVTCGVMTFLLSKYTREKTEFNEDGIYVINQKKQLRKADYSEVRRIEISSSRLGKVMSALLALNKKGNAAIFWATTVVFRLYDADGELIADGHILDKDSLTRFFIILADNNPLLLKDIYKYTTEENIEEWLNRQEEVHSKNPKLITKTPRKLYFDGLFKMLLLAIFFVFALSVFAVVPLTIYDFLEGFFWTAILLFIFYHSWYLYIKKWL